MSRKKLSPKMSLKDGEDYIAKLRALGADIPEVCRKAIYPAAGMVADAVNEEISGLAVADKAGQGTLSAKQRAGLHQGLGIAAFREDDGFLNVKIGFDGYNEIKTERWPNGQPNAMIARSLERGTTFWKANPFCKRAVKKIQTAAEQKMQQVLDEEIDRLLNAEK